MSRSRVTIRKYGGDDKYSWSVWVDGRRVVSGCLRSEAQYHADYFKRQHSGADSGRTEPSRT